MNMVEKYLEEHAKAMKEVYGYEEREVLNETNLYQDRQNGLYIGVFVDVGRLLYKDPYFKVSWKPINTHNNDVARISMSTGDYVIHYNTSVVVDGKIQKLINKAFEKTAKDPMSLWDSILDEIAGFYPQYTSFKKLKKEFPQIPIALSNLPSDCKKIRWGK